MAVAEGTSRASIVVRALRLLQRARDGLDVLVTIVGVLSGGLFLLLSFYITLDVCGRYFLGVSTRVSDELSGYALAVGGTWAFAYALKAGGHVTLAILFDYYPRPVQIALELLSLALLALVALGVSVLTWQLALDSQEMGGRSMGILSTPLVIPQGSLAVGFTLLTLQAIVMLFGQIADLVLGTAPREATAPGALSH